MNATVIKVEVECLWFAFSEGERCRCFGGVGEPVQLGQAYGTVALLDVAKDTAGADRGELLIISDQPDTRTSIDGELDGCVEGESVGHAGFVDDHQCRRPDRGRPVGQVAVPQRPGELGEGVAADAGLLTKNSGCGRGRGEAEDLAAVLGPGESEGTHCGGFPGAGGGDRKLQPDTRGAHLPDQRSLPGIQGRSVRRHLQQCQIHRRLVDG